MGDGRHTLAVPIIVAALVVGCAKEQSPPPLDLTTPCVSDVSAAFEAIPEHGAMSLLSPGEVFEDDHRSFDALGGVATSRVACARILELLNIEAATVAGV